ncbi:hypothetical protein X971_4567 [Agrobacterium tumefaciens LBA4213 (Ach5)]|nr:hypothetical protein X971_4567 [Agrobacterium tumefaciens LBA4213 (Ach5)]
MRSDRSLYPRFRARSSICRQRDFTRSAPCNSDPRSLSTVL